MCGLYFSLTDNPLSEDQIKSIHREQHHRGPDANTTHVVKWRDKHLSFLHQRLSIIDLQTGHQPVVVDDKVLLFNGEVFNHRELRKELEEEGVSFHTDHSDSEVLLRGYLHWGEGVLEKLHGMFSFIVWDGEEIFLCRDRMGIKPLYYLLNDGELYVASEMRTLLSLGLKKNLNHRALSHYLSLQYVPSKETIIEGIERLRPGHWMRVNAARPQRHQERYYFVDFSTIDREITVADEDEIREELDQAIKLWCESDVPIAMSLSGGLDSTAVLARAQGPGDIYSYSLGFHEKEIDELELCEAGAKAYGSKFFSKKIRPADILADLDQMVLALDEPYGGGLPSWFVYKMIKRKVALTGSGGDELFGNYGRWIPMEMSFARKLNHYLRSERLGPWNALKKSLIQGMEHYKLYHEYSEFSSYLIHKGEDVRQYMNREVQESLSFRDQVAWFDLNNQLPEEFLRMTDRFSMHFSIEARTPFLDHRLMEKVLAYKWRTKRTSLKGALKKVITPWVPKGHLEARKKGFVLPYEKWLCGELAPVFEKYFSGEYLKAQGVFHPEVRSYLEGIKGSVHWGSRWWTFFMFQKWFEIYKDRYDIQT